MRVAVLRASILGEIMKNPFRYGQIVEKENFCNRENELKEIKRAIENGYSFWIYSPRRFGKTSLIKRAFSETKTIKTLYLDLYNIQSLEDFADKYSKLIIKNLFDWKMDVKALGKKTKQYFKNINPSISFDAEGMPSFSLSSSSIEDQKDIEVILDIPEKISVSMGIQICIAFDEFQEINRIEPFIINWMRSSFQAHKNVSYIFLGSKQSLMENIFADSNSPFYEFGFKIPIYEISAKDWNIFIKNKFSNSGIDINENTISEILEKSNNHPHFTQYFSSVVWELLYEGENQNDRNFNDLWMKKIIAAQTIVFQGMYDQLNQNQRKTLISIASLSEVDQLFSAKYIKKNKLPASSSLSTILKSLMKNGYIYKSKELKYKITNPVFKEWLLRL